MHFHLISSGKNLKRLAPSILLAFLCTSVNTLGDTIPLTMTNSGFETSDTIGVGFPNVFGVWGGDKSDIVTTENGITAFEGSQMLHFINTKKSGPGSTVGSDVWQFIDTSGFSFEIATGMAILSATAFFNRVPGNANSDTLFQVRIDAYSGALLPRKQSSPARLERFSRMASSILGNKRVQA